MDKSLLIGKITQEPEERLLLARVLDQYQRMERSSSPTVTQFLSPREQQLAKALLSSAHIPNGCVLDGGYTEAERQCLLFLPDWCVEPPEELAFLRASFHGKNNSLSHRELLGSLMGLGITREKLGDILVSPHSADLVALPTLATYLCQNWVSAGRVTLSVAPIERSELHIPVLQTKTLRDTVSSLRLDAIVAAAFSVSRGRAAELIAAGRVSLEHLPCEKADKLVSSGQLLSVRGLGRVRLSEVGGTTKKGRISITLERYQNT